MDNPSSLWGRVGDITASKHDLGPQDGLRIVVSEYGATLLSCLVPDGKGGTVDVVLGCDSPEDTVRAGTYFGTTVGRYGNRIKRGRFELNGRSHQLACNEGRNHLHGGDVGFDKRMWSVARRGANAISFGLVSPDGEEGFPGTLIAQSTYEVVGDTLRYALLATVDQPSPVSLLNHSYWNLAGAGDVLDHLFQFNASFYTPCDRELMLTGEISSVADTPFDFTTPRTARERIGQIDNSGAGRVVGQSGGYDHNLVLDGYDGNLRPVGRISDPRSQRFVEISTTEPGLHFYTGGYLHGVARKGGGTYGPFAGFTLETQKFPDSPNIGHFPNTVLQPGQLYRHVTELKFGIES